MATASEPPKSKISDGSVTTGLHSEQSEIVYNPSQSAASSNNDYEFQPRPLSLHLNSENSVKSNPTSHPENAFDDDKFNMEGILPPNIFLNLEEHKNSFLDVRVHSVGDLFSTKSENKQKNLAESLEFGLSLDRSLKSESIALEPVISV